MIYQSAVTDSLALRTISLEANYISNAVQAIASHFPSLLAATSKGFDRLKSIVKFKAEPGDANALVLSNNEKKIQELLSVVSYSELTRLRLAVPEGFIGNYTNYFLDLQKLFDYHDNVCLPAFDEFYITVASIVTNKDAKMSLKDKSSLYKALAKNREETNASITNHFLHRSTQSEQEYQKLFTDNNDVMESFRQRHRLVARLEGVKIETMTDYVNKINDVLELMIKMAKEGSIENFSPVQMKNITLGAYEMAYQAEFFAINYYRAQNAIVAASQLQDKLLTRLKNAR